MFSAYNPILEHTEISKIHLCIEAPLEFLPNFHQWRPVQNSGSRKRCLFNSTQVQRASQAGLAKAEMRFLIKDALHHHTQAQTDKRRVGITLTPQILPSDQRELRTKPSPAPGPSSLLQRGKGRILVGEQELCDLPTLCGVTPASNGGTKINPARQQDSQRERATCDTKRI